MWPNLLSDLEDLLEQWRADPKRHGEEFGSRLYALAYRYIRKRVRDDAAKDLAQSTVATALAKHEDFVGGSLQRWVNKIHGGKLSRSLLVVTWPEGHRGGMFEPPVRSGRLCAWSGPTRTTSTRTKTIAGRSPSRNSTASIGD